MVQVQGHLQLAGSTGELDEGVSRVQGLLLSTDKEGELASTLLAPYKLFK